jgi:hypothetical protein
VMLLAISSVTLADTSTKVYADYMFVGQVNEKITLGSNSASGNADFSSLILGGQVLMDKFKLSGELSLSSQYKSGSKSNNMNFSEFRGGYIINEGDQSRIEAFGSFLTVDWADEGVTDSGLLVGLEGNFMLSDKLSLEGSYGYGISCTTDWSAASSVNLSELRARLNFIMNDNTAIYFGYRCYYETFKRYYGNEDITFSGNVLGVIHKF